jgi:hypothetical protein
MPSDLLIDTQILSRAFNGTLPLRPGHAKIASTTAKEFLLAQTRGTGKPLYYVLHPLIYSRTAHMRLLRQPEHIGNPKWAKMGSHRTDQLTIDFGGQFPAYREYSDQALALALNRNERELYKWSISHLSKYRRKYLIDRFGFLLDSSLECLSISDAVVDKALELFLAFTENYNCKNNVANTVNDILIVATAITHTMRFRTEDALLARFAAAVYNAPVQETDADLIIDFSKPTKNSRRLKRDSKGYVNRGWSYAIRNQREVGGR